jgi:hypothetical protein
MHIGEVMRRQYELPQELPHQLLTLLTRLTRQRERMTDKTRNESGPVAGVVGK